MAGYDGYNMPAVDFSTLGSLGDIYKKAQLDAERKRILGSMAGGNTSTADIAKTLFGIGDLEGGMSLTKLAETQAQHEWTKTYQGGMLDVARRGLDKPTDDIKEYEYATKNGFQGTLDQWMQRKRAGAGEYGLNPIWGQDDKGNPVMLQAGKSGEAVQSKLPAGVTLRGKDPIKMDAGTHFVLIDPITRAVIGNVPKDIMGKEAAEEIGKATGQAHVNLPQVISNADLALKNIDDIRKHPGKSSIFAVGLGGVVGGIPGTEQKGFVALVDQLKGKTFLQAFDTLRGGGAITEKEGSKAESAIARLDRAQSRADFDAALRDLEEVLTAGKTRARYKAEGLKRLGVQSGTQPVRQATEGITSAVTPEGVDIAPAQSKQRLKFNPSTGDFE